MTNRSPSANMLVMDFELLPEQRAYIDKVRAFAAERVALTAAAIDQSGHFPVELVREAWALGLAGMIASSKAGGGGRDHVTYALAVEAVARASATLAVIIAVQNSLVVEPLERFGSRTQKDRWLSRLATGQAIGAFALSEERAGSDAANQQTVARPDGGGYTISGNKVWVANGEAADVAIVFAATDEPPRRGIGAFLVPLDAAGVMRTSVTDSLGVRGLGCVDMALDHVRVDADAIFGGPADGFRIAMWALDGGRVAIAAQALGVGHAALDAAIAHAKSREAFGQSIGNYQAIQWMIADVATELDAARMLMLKAADSRQRGEADAAAASLATVDAAMAKLLSSEAAHRAADKAMQILASSGYRSGSLVERLFRDARATEIYQGTSEVQRMVISQYILS